MKQKLSLACVLLQRPKLLLLDEPTVGVDPFSRLELWELLNSIKSEDIGIIITTTTMEEAKYCDRLIFLHQNTILKDSQPLELLEQYKQQTFLVTTEKQTLRELQQQLKTIPGIMSTLIRGQFLRLLLSKPSTLNEFAKLLPNDCHITESQANYDDAFVASVKHIEKRLQVTTYDSPAIAATDAVVVNDIVKCFGTRTVVNHITFSIKRGEIFGLLGANGAGKTTTFKMICGLLPMASGEIQIAGISLTKDSVRARSRIGYVAQKFSLYAELTVLQNLEFFCNVYNMIDSKKIVQQTLENFSLQEFKNQCSGQLPYGIQRRLSMACALMHEPAIIFLDEPTSGVDPFGRRDFWDNIQALVARGVTVLITTHHLEEAEYCDRIGLLHQGNLILQGPPIAIRTQISKQLQRECTLEEAFINLIQQQEAVDVT